MDSQTNKQTNNQTYGHETKKQTYEHETKNRHMDMRQKTDTWIVKQTAKGTQGVYFGMSDKPYFDP